jgi:hypothetical protein
MSHSNNERQPAIFQRNRRSVWIEREGDAYEVTAKHGIRVVATATTETHAAALAIAEALKTEHRAGEIVDRTG